MKAIVVHEFGGPEKLKLEEVPTPKPAAGQVLVRVHAAGVNPYDTYMRAGTYAVKPPLPYTPGSDAAGVVEAVGEGVKKVKPGERVYTAKTLTGAYAEYCLVMENQVHALPANVSFAQGAGVFVPYVTAFFRPPQFGGSARLGNCAHSRRQRRRRHRCHADGSRNGSHRFRHGRKPRRASTSRFAKVLTRFSITVSRAIPTKS